MASKFEINPTPPRRGQIKIKIFKMLGKSLQNLAIGVGGGGKKKGAGSGGCCSSIPTVVPVGGFKSASEGKIHRNRPKRGQVKIKIFKSIAESVKDLATGVSGREKKAVGNGGGSGGCFSLTATMIPLETVGGLKPRPASKHEIKEDPPSMGQIKIKICKMTGGSVFQVPNSGGKKKMVGGGWFEIVPMAWESER